MVGEEVDFQRVVGKTWRVLFANDRMSSLFIFLVFITGRFCRQKVGSVVMSAEIAGLWGCMYVTLQGRWSWHLGAGDRRSELS